MAVALCFHLFSACYIVLQTKSSIKNASAVNPATMENTDDLRLQMYGSHALCYCKLIPWAVGKKKWDTMKDKGKSMLHALYVLWYAKRDVSGQNDIKLKKSSP